MYNVNLLKLPVSLHHKCKQNPFILSGILAKSGPLDFATKNSFPLFFVCEKGLVHMYQNHFIYFPILYFRFATSQKPILPATGFPAVIKRLKCMDFERRVTAN